MARRIIRRRRPAVSRRVVVSRQAPAAAQAAPRIPQAPAKPEGSPVVVATSGAVRNLVLPKLALIDDVSLVGLADTPSNALKMLIQEHPEAVILDADFGGPFNGLDLAKTMQKTRSQAAIIMLLPDLDAEQMKTQSRRFGTSWSYLRKNTAYRAEILDIALKSSIRGVQWIDPDLTRPLNAIWKIADQARDLEAKAALSEPDIYAPSPANQPPKIDEAAEIGAESDPDEIAPGIKVKSTNENDYDGLNITSISVGKGGIGSDVGKVRRAG